MPRIPAAIDRSAELSARRAARATLSILAAAVDRATRSPVNYWAGFVVDALGIAAFVFLGLRSDGEFAATTCFVLLAGYGGWTLWEYYVHRFLFHESWSPLSHGHLAHHAAPRQTIGLPFFVAGLIAITLFLAARLLMPSPYPHFFVAGAYVGWLYYGVLHHLEHATDLSLASYRRLRRHHFVHHAVESANFGVSTTLWDRVFGTRVERRGRTRASIDE